MKEDYPRNQLGFENRFSTESACIEYLRAMRWPAGFVCPRCAGKTAWQTKRGLFHCSECGVQTSATAGTILHRTRKPLLLWFRAMWHITNQNCGANALGLQRVLDLGSYHTAWQWLHKLRRAMVRPGRDCLSGLVEMDETFVGGRKKPGKRGCGAAGKAVVGVAVEDKGEEGIGRIRLQHLADQSGASLIAFAQAVVQPGTSIRTDNWDGYWKLYNSGFHRLVTSPSEMQQSHLVASLLKRWLLGTYQGAVRPSHLAYYLDELTFRFNRRTSASRGKLFYRLVQQAMMVDPAPRATLKGPTVPFLVETSDGDLDSIDGN
jgi:hypothetical protein